MPYIQIKISETVASLLEEAKATGSGFEFRSTLHGLEIEIAPGARPKLTGSFSNFKVVAEPQIVIEERHTFEEEAPQAEPSKVISLKLPYSGKKEAIENRRNLLVGCLQRVRPGTGISQEEIKDMLRTQCGVECSTTTVNSDLNELKRLGRITSYTEKGIGIVYRVVEPSIEAIGF